MRRIRGIFIDSYGLKTGWQILCCLLFALVFILSMSAVAISISESYNERTCATIAQESGKKTKYVSGTCFIKIDGDYVPVGNWKVQSED